MGGKMSRNKGARGEREVVKLLQPIVERCCTECGCDVIMLQRNLLQAHRGGHDLFGLDWISMEIKYQESPSIGSWWRQTLNQCGKGQTPVLVYRSNHQPWKVRMRVPIKVGESAIGVRATVTVDIQTFLVYFEQRMKVELSSE